MTHGITYYWARRIVDAMKASSATIAKADVIDSASLSLRGDGISRFIDASPCRPAMGTASGANEKLG